MYNHLTTENVSLWAGEMARQLEVLAFFAEDLGHLYPCGMGQVPGDSFQRRAWRWKPFFFHQE